MFLPLLGRTQLITVSGNVMHSENGKSIEDVSIFESNANIGTITNKSGFYKLELNSGELDIKISADGFKTFSKKMVLKNDTILFVKLELELNSKSRVKKNSELKVVTNSGKKYSGKQ